MRSVGIQKLIIKCWWNQPFQPISPTFCVLLGHQYYFAKKLQSQTVSGENLYKMHAHGKFVWKMLAKLITGVNILSPKNHQAIFFEWITIINMKSQFCKRKTIDCNTCVTRCVFAIFVNVTIYLNYICKPCNCSVFFPEAKLISITIVHIFFYEFNSGIAITN